MIVVQDDGGRALWDFSSQSSLCVFGGSGGGKTTVARYIALSWAEAGGTVVLGHQHERQYQDLYPIVHRQHERKGSMDAAVEYGRLMDADPRDHGLLIVLDNVQALSERNKSYLQHRTRSNVAWVFLSVGPRAKWPDIGNLGVGRIRQKQAREAFDWTEDSGVPVLNPKGVTLRRLDNGVLLQQSVPRTALYGPASEWTGPLPFRNALPEPGRRGLYAPMGGAL